VDPGNWGGVSMCVSSCPKIADDDICFYDNNGADIMDDYCFKTYPTTAFGSYCVPLEMNDYRKIIDKYISNTFTFMQRIGGDFLKVKISPEFTV
jgi:hypothetical protein